MIKLLNKISIVNLNMYGIPILKGIQDKQENGTKDNLTIPFEFKYNGSWKIDYRCSSCNSKVEFGDVFDGNHVKRENYTPLKYLCSKYYSNKFLEIFPKIFSDTEIVVVNDNYYVISNSVFEKDFPVTSSIEPLFFQCNKCLSEYLCRFRQGFPIEPDPSNPKGTLGVIFIDEIINIKVKEGDSFFKLTETHRKNDRLTVFPFNFHTLVVPDK
ncbi:MAG: hypothetical protein HC831_08970 [Chloroflexia bacterium]|nr:hypothetical protein [Chloroflexia bacterium]